MKRFAAFLIEFYQKFLSVFSYGSCRYYPTCSHYSKIQFEKNTFFKAIYFTITRLLKCNQLFDGGFDYPVIKFKPKNIAFKKIDIIYWYVPVKEKKDHYYIIKNRNWTNEHK